MKLSGLDIMPITIHLSDEEWQDRMNAGLKHFMEQGIDGVWLINGIHAENAGVEASRAYDRDPQNIETGWKIPARTVGNYISWIIAFNVMASHPEINYWMILEDDTRFHDNWRERAEQALKDVPPDFDYLLLSHCCTQGRETEHVQGEVFEVKYPQAGHVAIVAKKAIPTILKTATNASYPFDVNLFDFTFPHLKVYTLLPRLAEQENTHLPE